MEDVTLSWPGKMTTAEAKKYLLTKGFVAVELFNTLARGKRYRFCDESLYNMAHFEEDENGPWMKIEGPQR